MFRDFVNWFFSTIYDVLQLPWPGTNLTFWQIYLGALVFSGLMTILVGWALSSSSVDADFAKPIRENGRSRPSERRERRSERRERRKKKER